MIPQLALSLFLLSTKRTVHDVVDFEQEIYDRDMGLAAGKPDGKHTANAAHIRYATYLEANPQDDAQRCG